MWIDGRLTNIGSSTQSGADLNVTSLQISKKSREVGSIAATPPHAADCRNRSGLQMSAIRNLALAWVLTLPIAILLAGSLYWLFTQIF